MSNVRRFAARTAKVRSQTRTFAEGAMWEALAEIRAAADLLAMVEDVTALDPRTVQDAAGIIRSRAIDAHREFRLYTEMEGRRPPDETEPEHAQ